MLTWNSSYEPAPPVEDAVSALVRTEAAWREWSDRCTYDGEYRDEVLRSLITLKALTHELTGALVAAPTTSLPEEHRRRAQLGLPLLLAARLRRLTLAALLGGGYTEEAIAFARLAAARARPATRRSCRSCTGSAGERRLTEFELDELPGYEGSTPVRVGNAAADQFQLDVYGELALVSHMAIELGLEPVTRLGALAGASSSTSRRIWREPDEGIWEVRGPRRHFTHSKVMAWVVFDRAVKIAERFGLDAPRRALAADPRRDPRAGLRAGLRPRAEHVHAVLRLRGARRGACS